MISWLQAVALFVSIEFELESHEQIELVLWLVVAAVSLITIVIFFFISYIRIKSMKLLTTALAFSIFFVKGMVLSMKLFVTDYLARMETGETAPNDPDIAISQAALEIIKSHKYEVTIPDAGKHIKWLEQSKGVRPSRVKTLAS